MENVKQYGRLRSCNEIISYIKISLSRLKKKARSENIWSKDTDTNKKTHKVENKNKKFSV